MGVLPAQDVDDGRLARIQRRQRDIAAFARHRHPAPIDRDEPAHPQTRSGAERHNRGNRDSRAVAYSWTRSKTRPSPVGKQNYMPRFRPTDTAVKWTMANASFHALAPKATAYQRLIYEQFVADPERAAEGIARRQAGFSDAQASAR